MNSQAKWSQTASLSDLAATLAACPDGASLQDTFSSLHSSEIGAVLCSLEPLPLAALLGKLGETGCAALFAELADEADVLPALRAKFDTLSAPHVAPVDVGGKLSPVSKVTIDKAKAAAVGRAYKATADVAIPDLSAIAESKLAAELSDYGVEQAEKRGADDVAFAKLVKSARSHGATCGASTHRKDAVKWAQTLGDKMFLPVAVLLDLELCEFGKDGEPTAADFPLCADSAPLLVEYVGLANIAIKAAQEKALESMPDDATAKQRSAACKGARNTIGMRIERQLKKYGVKVNLQTGNYSEVDLEGGATTAEKATKAVVGAFGKSTEGALVGLAALDGAAWSAMVEFVTTEQAKRDRTAQEAQNVSLSALSIANAIKAKATDDAARAAAKLDAQNS
jgi:hypothetical protein